jgi:hypothetical protein
MSMDVNETRRDETTIHVDHLSSPERASRGDLDNPITLNADVTPKPGIPASIHNLAIGKHEI